MDALFGVLTIGLILGIIFYESNKLKKKDLNIRLAAIALGDNFYITGVPNTAWTKYASSFSEYQRLLHALAESGDFSKQNVERFVTSFKTDKGQDADKAKKQDAVLDGFSANTQHTGPGAWGYNQIGNDEGYTNYELINTKLD